MKNKKNFEEDLSTKIKILTPLEQKQYYGLPEFSPEQKKQNFSLDKHEYDLLNSLKSINSKVLFILELGYFKVKQRFFSFKKDEVLSDIEFIIKTYFPKARWVEINFSKNTKTTHRQSILNIFSYKDWKPFKKEFMKRAKDIVSIDSYPQYIFKELLRFAINNRIVLPPYREIQILITQTLSFEEKRVFSILESLVDNELRELVQSLLTKNDQETHYLLSTIRLPITGFCYSDVFTEVDKQRKIKPIYEKAKKILPELKVSNLTIKYFAKALDNYNLNNFKRFHENKQLFIVLCFVYYRYMNINDNLVKTFLYLIDKYENEIKISAEKQIIVINNENRENLKKIPQILALFYEKKISEQAAFKEVKNIVFEIIDEEKIKMLSEYLIRANFDKKYYEWLEYDKKYNTIKRNIRYIFQTLDFTHDKINKNAALLNLFLAINFLKSFLGNKRRNFDDAPPDFINFKDYKYLFEIKVDKNGKKYKQLNFKRYELLVYIVIKNRLHAGDIFFNDSLDHRSLEDDLISPEDFENNYDQIAEMVNLPLLSSNFEELLDKKLEMLEERIQTVNKNILEGKNQHLKITDEKKKTWTLSYEGLEDEEVNNPIFVKLPQIELIDLIRFVNKKTQFLSGFTHILGKYAKTELDENTAIAAIIAYGTNIGISKMSVSSGISYNHIKQSGLNYFREETLKIANEKIINEMAGFPVFEYYNIIDDLIHSSSDGQRFNVSGNVFNARHSVKNPGREKGLTVLTLTANYSPLNSKVISGNEYEGHHVLELLLMNESNIQPKIHSTDTHGTNKINHVLLDFCDYYFSPRYKDLNSKFKFLYGSNPVREYDSKFILSPMKKINRELILSEEKNIKRVIASIMLKNSTVSTIVKKLNSYQKSNKTMKALIEYDKICRSIHILDFIDSLKLRQSTQTSLNRVEAYHQLKRAVFYANFGRIRAKIQSEQTIYQECNRLICSAIIFYNSYILSEFLKQKTEMGETEQIEAIKRISPVAWTHVNLYGKFDFSKEEKVFEGLNIEEILRNQYLIDEDEII